MARISRIVLGLNSGTSADGVDAVACEITGRGLGMKVRVIGHVHRPYRVELRNRLLAVMAPAATRTEEICRLETEVGGAFADGAAAAVKRLGLKRVDLIGSHGQTICHLPPRSSTVSSRERARLKARTQTTGTLQIGDSAIIAARLRCSVVHHFRQADMAVGGQGAPLVPWTDYVLFRHPKKTRIIQNIGGIANLTYLPAGGGLDDVIAFDTGPGNMVIDALVRHFSKGRKQFDEVGRWAAKGRVDLPIYNEMFDHPYFMRPPPKSCGREQFGETWVTAMLRRHARRALSPADWVRSATVLTAETILFSVQAFVLPEEPSLSCLHEMILYGGGAHNATLRQLIQSGLRDTQGLRRVSVLTTDDRGIPIQAKEGVSFAILAAACVDRVPANLPQVTGATRRVVLGQICGLEDNS